MAIAKLKQMLKWSDRLGSDEVIEVNEVIKLLKDGKNSNNKLRNTK